MVVSHLHLNEKKQFEKDESVCVTHCMPQAAFNESIQGVIPSNRQVNQKNNNIYEDFN